MKMFQSNIYNFMNIKVYIVSIDEIYGVLSLSMEFYLCLWNYIFVYGVLSLFMEFYLCLRTSIFVYGVLSLSMARLGAKYAEVGCKVNGYFWVRVFTF